MQSPHHPVGRHALVVLDEVDAVAEQGRDLRIEVALGETLKEIASRVVEHARFENQEALYVSLVNSH